MSFMSYIYLSSIHLTLDEIESLISSLSFKCVVFHTKKVVTNINYIQIQLVIYDISVYLMTSDPGQMKVT